MKKLIAILCCALMLTALAFFVTPDLEVDLYPEDWKIIGYQGQIYVTGTDCFGQFNVIPVRNSNGTELVFVPLPAVEAIEIIDTEDIETNETVVTDGEDIEDDEPFEYIDDIEDFAETGSHSSIWLFIIPIFAAVCVIGGKFIWRFKKSQRI